MNTTTDQTAPTQPCAQAFYCSGCQEYHEAESLLEAVRREGERIRSDSEELQQPVEFADEQHE